MEKLIRVLEGITATLWAITILYSIFFFSLGGFLLNDIFQEILILLLFLTRFRILHSYTKFLKKHMKKLKSS